MKIITPYVANEEQKMDVKQMNAELFEPRRDTLDFICRFARIYKFEPRLGNEELGSFMMN